MDSLGRPIFTFICLTMSLILTTNRVSADVCSDTTYILNQENNSQGQSLKDWIVGNRDGDPDKYIPSFVLPNAKYCYMTFQDDPDYQYYICVWHFTSEKEMREARTDIVNALRKCPAISDYDLKERRSSESDDSRSVETHDFINITEAQEDIAGLPYAHVVVEISHNYRSDGNLLIFTVSGLK